MDTMPPTSLVPRVPEGPIGSPIVVPSLSRRGFLRGAALTGGGLLAATLAACTSTVTNGWSYPPQPSNAAGAASPSAAASAAPSSAPSAAPSAAASAAASAEPSGSAAPSAAIPAGWTQHDVDARNVVRRYLGDLAPALKDIYGPAAFAKLADILGAEDGYPELTAKPAFAQVPQLVLNDILQPLKPTIDNGVKVFELTVDEIEQRIDEKMPPVAALGYNKQWPGPTIRSIVGQRPTSFAYPFGDTNRTVLAGVAVSGVAVALMNRDIGVEDWADRFALPRIEIKGRTGAATVLRTVAAYARRGSFGGA